MKVRIGRLTGIAFFVLSVAAMAQDKVFEVRYLSAENVYLTGGSADGLAVGHRLILNRESGCTTELEVIFVAEHSASCAIIADSCRIAVGDRVSLVSALVQDSVPPLAGAGADSIRSDSATTARPQAKSFARPVPPKLTGSAALLLYNWNDRGQSNLDFTQATARVNLKVRRLFDREITFSLRTRGRYDQRQRAYTSQVERDAWENRIWELSFTYDDPQAAFNLAAGRILPRRVASAGYLDGLLVERRLSDHTRIGLLGGAHPRWAYDTKAVSLQKGGGYFSYISGEPARFYFEQTIAGIGEYHGSNVSRESILLQGRFNRGGQYIVYHTVEIDVNRSWRKEKTGKSVALSSVYVGGWYRFTPRIRVNVSYDNRVNYWTYDTRSTVDSMFDDHLRQGVRGQIDLTLPEHFQSSIGYGLRKRQGDVSATKSYSFNLNKSGLWRRTAHAFVQYSGFDGPFEHGYNYTARLTDYVSGSFLMGVGYGAYSYSADADLSHRTSRWYEMTGQADLGRRYFLSLSAQQNSGDDIDGLRLQSEIGWRF